MAEDEKKASSGGLTKLLATFGTALIVFFASQIWHSYEKTGNALEELNSRLKDLEDDKSKWGTLTELHNKTLSMEIEMGRLEGMMQGFSLAVNGGLVEKPETPVPGPPRPAPIPELKDPKDLFKNPEDYRNMQQKKYEPPPKK